MEKLRIGVIGAGAISRRGHLPVWKKIPNVEVKAIVDLDGNLAKSVKEEFQIKDSFSNYEKILSDSNIDVVDICTPPSTHHGMILAALKAKKHILVEKPMTLSLNEAKEVYQAVKKSGITLCVIYNYRYFPVVAKVKKRLNKGYLGRIVTIHGSGLAQFPVSWTRATWPYHYGGTLYDFGPHLIDLLLWLNDSSPTKVFASGGDITDGNMGFINYALIQLEFEDKSLAACDISWITGTNVLKIEIHGTGGHIMLDVKNNWFSEFHGTFTPMDDLREFKERIKSTVKGVLNRSFFKGPLSLYQPFLNDFVRSLKEGTPPPVTVKEGLTVDAVLEAAKISIKEKRVVELENFLEDI